MAQNEKLLLAKQYYSEGMKMVDIAKKLDVPAGTIRRWKNTYHWDSERSEKKANVFDKKSERSHKKRSPRKEPIDEPVPEEILLAAENTDLNDKQRLFCILYTRCFNATKAYQKAYGCSYETAVVNGSRMLRNAKVKEEIVLLKQNRMNQELLSEADIFQKYMDIAFADITDYVEFGRETVPVMGAFGPVMVKDDKTGKKVKLMQEVNTVRFRESPNVDGTIISEIKQGKSGASIKLADRMKALKWLTEHMNMATEEQRLKMEIMRRKAAGGDVEAELEKLDKVLAEIKGVI